MWKRLPARNQVKNIGNRPQKTSNGVQRASNAVLQKDLVFCRVIKHGIKWESQKAGDFVCLDNS